MAHITIRVEPEVLARIDTEAEKRGLSRTAMILDRWLKPWELGGFRARRGTGRKRVRRVVEVADLDDLP